MFSSLVTWIFPYAFSVSIATSTGRSDLRYQEIRKRLDDRATALYLSYSGLKRRLKGKISSLTTKQMVYVYYYVRVIDSETSLLFVLDWVE